MAFARDKSALTQASRQRPKLRTQLLVGFVGIVAIPFIVFAAIAGTRLAARADLEAARHLAIEAQTVAERVDEYIESHRRGITLVATGARGTMNANTDFLSKLRELGSSYDDFLTLMVADSVGRIVAAHVPANPSASTGATLRSVADRPYFREAMANNAPFLSDAFRGRGLGNDAIVAISAPISNNKGKPAGIVEGSLDLRRFAQFAHGALIRAAGRLIIVDSNGRVVYSSGAEQMEVLQEIDSTPLGRALKSSSKTNAIEYEDRPGSGVLVAAVARSKTTGWRVVVAQSHAQAQAEGRAYLLTILVGVALAALISVLLALRMSRRVTMPIEELIAALRLFGTGKQQSPVKPPVSDAPEEVAALVNEFAGMSARVFESTAAKEASESRFRAVFDHAAIGIAVHDLEGFFIETNAAFQKIVGYSQDELRTMRASDLSPKEAAAVTRAPVRALQAGEVDKVLVEKPFVHRDGHIITCELTVSRLDVEVAPGRIGGIVGMLQDVTDRRRMERDMAWRANHDVLTGLANRAQLHERLHEALGVMRVPGSVAVLVLDLDEFKRVNDSYGHAAGDQLLCEVSRRLLSATRGCDVVARLGGDEFAMLLDGVDNPVFADIAAKRILASLTRPIVVDGAELIMSTSIGIAYAGPDDTVDSVVRNADTAMYRAKHGGKGRFDIFTAAMHEEVLNLLSLETDLRQAIESDELRAVYQLIVDLRTGAPVGAECLLRWDRDGHGTVSPQQFIPVAEQTGLIVPIGRWILREACRQGALWQSRITRREGAAPPFSITVNVSGRQLQHASLIDDVRDALADSGFNPRALVLELTESVVMSDAATVIRRLEELRALGVRLAIDDFGTGYSSLSYLQLLPIDILKIDKSFVDRLTHATRDTALVRTILGLADSLSLRCVAEGIENAEQRSVLSSLGCHYGQGYLFARPLDASEAGWLLAQELPRDEAA